MGQGASIRLKEDIYSKNELTNVHKNKGQTKTLKGLNGRQ